MFNWVNYINIKYKQSCDAVWGGEWGGSPSAVALSQETIHLNLNLNDWMKKMHTVSVSSFFLMMCWQSGFHFEPQKQGDEDWRTVILILTLKDHQPLNGELQLCPPGSDVQFQGSQPTAVWVAFFQYLLCIWIRRIDWADISAYVYPWWPTYLLTYKPLRKYFIQYYFVILMESQCWKMDSCFPRLQNKY